MFIKVTTRYKDKVLEAELPVGTILEVPEERGKVIIDAGKAEEYTFPSTTKSKGKKSEEEVASETIVTPSVTLDVPEDAWKEPKAKKSSGK